MRTLKRARLPTEPLSRSLQFCSAVLNGGDEPSFPPLEVARRVGMSPTSSHYRARLASARAFGLIEGRGQLVITPRARAALGTGAAALQARVDAVLSSGLGGIIEALEDEVAREGPVAQYMEGTGLVSHSAARPLARALISSAQSAGLIGAGRFQPSAARGRMRLLDQPLPMDITDRARPTGPASGPAGGGQAPLGVIELTLAPRTEELLSRLLAHLDAGALGTAAQGEDKSG